MKLFRKILFWLHLVAGIGAAVVVVIMSFTGVALTYQRQMQAWADRGNWRPASVDVPRLTVEQLHARLLEQEPASTPTTITLRSGTEELATAALTGARTGNVLVDPFTGQIVPNGPSSDRVRSFFSTMVSWHRYLAATGESRATGRAVTGASNLAFLFLVLSGFYLWWPRNWTWAAVRSVLWFRRRLPGKARDFNWHNVLGFWSALPLAIVVASGVVISYPWASNLVYRVVGEAPPAPAAGRGGGAGAEGGRGGGRGSEGGRGGGRRLDGGGGQAGAGQVAPPTLSGTPVATSTPAIAGLDAVMRRAAAHVDGWRSLTVRLPTSPSAPVTVTVDQGDGGQPQKRGTLTLNRATAEVTGWEPFSNQTPGRRLRSLLRFAHTGEVLGLTGQTVAGLVSAASLVLAYTGIALALRRFSGWLRRRSRRGDRLPLRATSGAERDVA
jgi:uncharacterized iron-regulated membrane protein